MTLVRMSHSRYDDYASCGEKYRLKRIARVPTSPGIYRVTGTGFHEWTDYFDTSPPWETEVSHEEWYANRIHELIAEEEEKSGFAFQEWDHPQRKAGANEAARDKFINELGPDMIRKYIEWRANTAWQVAFMACFKCEGVSEINERPCRACGATGGALGIEYEVSFTLDGVENIAKIDRIFQIPETGQLVAIDTKTWSKKRVTSQLPTYLVALRQAGFSVMGAGYYESRKGSTTPILDYKYWDEDRLAALHAQAARMIDAGWFLPSPGDQCRMCDVRNFCLWYLD